MTEWWWRLVRFGFRLLYNELAFTYDAVSVIVSLGEWRCWQRATLEHLGQPDGRYILELAFGTGNFQLDLHAAGYRPIGLDQSVAMGRIARRKLQRTQAPMRLVQGRAQQLPFAATSFKAVVCTFPTDFIFDDQTLSEIHRVLTPDGVLVIVPNGRLLGSDVITRGLEWLYRVTGQRGDVRIDVSAYFRPFGFQIKIIETRCSRSVAQVIIARKSV